ncbi:MAG: hypothetical protein LAT77_05875 [Aliidiomarina sp.]|uniref:hypothetical protein n=1 Tax=Aliidiomarina sp. TaxID=1872439 RepID=UPI0025C6FD58|nr:hypothetical protein [Aliidiomarina sp.]MCH8501427.1 hypothetical protein [Aliidiomarina sp.]
MSSQLLVEPVPSLLRAYFRIYSWRRELLNCHTHYFRRGRHRYLCISDKPCPNYLHWADKIDQSKQIIFCLLIRSQYLTIVWDDEKLIALMLSPELPTFLFDGLCARPDFIPTVYFDANTEAEITAVRWHQPNVAQALTTEQLLALQKVPRSLLLNGRYQLIFFFSFICCLLFGAWFFVKQPARSIQQLPIDIAQATAEKQEARDSLIDLFIFPEWLKQDPEIYATDYQLTLQKGQIEFSTSSTTPLKRQNFAEITMNSPEPIDPWFWKHALLVGVDSSVPLWPQVSGKELQSSISQSFITDHVIMTLRAASNEADIIIRDGWIEDLASLALLFKKLRVTLTAIHITGLESQINGTLSVSWGG